MVRSPVEFSAGELDSARPRVEAIARFNCGVGSRRLERALSLRQQEGQEDATNAISWSFRVASSTAAPSSCGRDPMIIELPNTP